MDPDQDLFVKTGAVSHLTFVRDPTPDNAWHYLAFLTDKCEVSSSFPQYLLSL